MKLVSEWSVTVEVWAEDAVDAVFKAAIALARGDEAAVQKADEPGVTYVKPQVAA